MEFGKPPPNKSLHNYAYLCNTFAGHMKRFKNVVDLNRTVWDMNMGFDTAYEMIALYGAFFKFPLNYIFLIFV